MLILSSVEVEDPPEVAAARGVIRTDPFREHQQPGANATARSPNLRLFATVACVGALALIATNWLLEMR